MATEGTGESEEAKEEKPAAKGANDKNENKTAEKKISKGDFIEIEFTGKEKETNQVFDATAEKPAIVCVGQQHVIRGLDDSFVGRRVGDSYRVYIMPEQGFGRKDAKLLQLISTSKFTEQNIRPSPGLVVNIDGMMGTVRTVTGGRTVVDFNHPLASREIFYDVKIRKIIENPGEKLRALISIRTGIEPELSLDEGIAEARLPVKLPDSIEKLIFEEAREFIPGIKIINFSVVKKEKN